MKSEFESKTDFSHTPEKKARKSIAGYTITEVFVVVLTLAIMLVITLPSLIASRRLFTFYMGKQNVFTLLREARQKAMTEQVPITFRYDNSNKSVKLYGGSFGADGDAANRIISLIGNGLSDSDLIYGKPAGAPSGIPDGSNLTTLTGSQVEIVFRPTGSVVDGSGNPTSKALFFYDANDPGGSAWAVSIIGAGGRVKLWRYDQNANIYRE